MSGSAEISTLTQSGPFSFDGSSFLVNGTPREDNKRLKEILFPEKAWFSAQLRHYGIKFRASDTASQLRATLENAVKAGQCKNVPEDIAAVEKELRSKYEAMSKIAPKRSKNAKPTLSSKPSLTKISKEQNPPSRTRPMARKGFVFQTIETRKRAPSTAGSKSTVLSAATVYRLAKGYYDIEFPEITNQWGYCDFSLNIAGTTENKLPFGEFDFGMIEGVMKFSRSAIKDKDIEMLDIDEESISGKRKATSSGLSMKKVKTEFEKAQQSRQIHFQWRGREIEGPVHFNETVQTGYIEFDDDTCSTFRGVISIAGVGYHQPFRGYKEPDCTGQKISKSWEDYSKRIYEIEEQTRWH